MKIIKKIKKHFELPKREDTCLLKSMCANHIEYCNKCRCYIGSNK